jgi:hypothetical protein
MKAATSACLSQFGTPATQDFLSNTPWLAIGSTDFHSVIIGLS